MRIRDVMWLDQVDGGQGAYLDCNYDAVTAQDVWYDVYVKCRGEKVWAWRGTNAINMELVLYTEDTTVAYSIYLPFCVSQAGDYWLDDIGWHVPNNWDTFLHLSGDSPCIDTGQTDRDEHHHPIAFSDFDNQVGPLDGPNPPDDDADAQREIGADEYPTPDPDDFSLWWEQFDVE